MLLRRRALGCGRPVEYRTSSSSTTRRASPRRSNGAGPRRRGRARPCRCGSPGSLPPSSGRRSWTCRSTSRGLRSSSGSGRCCERFRRKRRGATRRSSPASGYRGRAPRSRQAIGRNPLAVVVPCQRVVDADGALAGYRWGLCERPSCHAASGGLRSVEVRRVRRLGVAACGRHA